MDQENSITAQCFTNSFDNFLQSGALLRHQGKWIVVVGPFCVQENQKTSEISVYWPDFYDLQNSMCWQGREVYIFEDGQFRDFIGKYLQNHGLKKHSFLNKAEWIEPSLDDFAVAFNSIHGKIQTGDIQKAVPAVFARSIQTLNPDDLVGMLGCLLDAPTSLYVYGFWQDGRGVLGATPEILFEYDQGELQTMALAGTYPKPAGLDRGFSAGHCEVESKVTHPLFHDPKERNEHQLVVEDLKSRLQKWGVVKTQGPYILELPLLSHLKTDLYVECSDVPNFLQLIKELHPTPALGVAPRSAGYQWMKEFPGQEGRAGFGAPFAFLHQEKALCLVAIRNIQWNKSELMIGSGCGVVAASQLEREWKELFQKRLSVKKILGL